MDVSVVIPTYNESENVGPLVESIEEELKDKDFEIIFVDDNSPDGTAEKIKDLRDEKNFLKLIEREGKNGIGSAYKKGLHEAKGDKIIQMDADFSHPPRYINDLLEALESNDVAVGSRYVEDGDRQDPIHRRIFPLIGSYLYRYGLGFPVKDFTSGFKAYNREVIEIFTDDLPDGFHFQAASLLKIVDNNYSVKEVPIEFEERRAGDPKYDHMDLVKNGLFFGKTFLEKHERPLKFGIVGGTGVFVDTGLLYFLTEFGGLHQVLSAALATETAILWNFTWNDLWTFEGIGKEKLKDFVSRALKFNTVSLVGLGLKVAVFWALTEFTGLYYLVANLVAIMMVFIWNYMGNVAWTWNED